MLYVASPTRCHGCLGKRFAVAERRLDKLPSRWHRCSDAGIGDTGDPTTAARLAAGASTTDTFTVTASNGVHTTSQTFTVPIDPAVPTVTDTISVGTDPNKAAISPDGSHIYVTNNSRYETSNGGTESVIDTATNAVVATTTITTTAL